MMRVGHGISPVDVLDGEPMGGYAARVGGLAGQLDPLEAHAISFASERTRFLLVVIDVICVNLDVVAAIKRRCAAYADAVWVCATHTHSGPESGCRPSGSSTPVGVADRIVAAAVAAADAAVADEREARIRVARDRVHDVASHRTDPEPQAVALPVDAVRVHDTGTGALRGILIVTPVHPTVLPASNLEASADLSGAVRRAAERRWGVWAVAATGAAGDISTRGVRRGTDTSELDRIAELIIDGICGDGSSVARDHGDAIAHGSAAGVLASNTLDAGALHVAPDGAAEGRWSEVYEQGRRALAELGGRHSVEPVPIVIEAVAAGPARFVGIPGEPFLALGERVHEATGAIVIGYANGYIGYLPVEGTPITYETIVSPVDAVASGEAVRLAVAAASALPVAVSSPGTDNHTRGERP